MEDLSLPVGSRGDGVQYFTPGQYVVSKITGNDIEFSGLTHPGVAFNQQVGVAPFATIWAWLAMAYCVRDGMTAYESQAVGQKQEYPARLMHSAFQEPENAPTLNYYDVGASDKEIIQFLPFGRFLYIFKQDGLYRLSGSYPSYSIEQFDPNIVLIGKGLVTTMGGSIYAWTSKGIYEITETSATRISYDIQSDISVINTNNYSNLKRSGFAVGNEDDHSVTFWAPNYIINKSGNFSSSENDIAFVYDGEGWTQRDDKALWATTGITDGGKVNLYTIKNNGTGWLTKERRSGSAADFADESLLVTLNTIPSDNFVRVTIDTDAASDIAAALIPVGSCLVFSNQWAKRGYVTSVTKIGTKQYELGIEMQNGSTALIEWTVFIGISNAGNLGLSFTVNWQYGINASDDPTIRKHFTDIGFIYQQPYFTKMDIGFSSDIRPAEVFLPSNLQGFLEINPDSTRIPCALPDDFLQDKVLKALVSTQYSRCSQLRVSLRHSRAFEYISIYGYFVRTSDGGMNIERNNNVA